MCRPIQFSNGEYLSATASAKLLGMSRPTFYSIARDLLSQYEFANRKQVFYKRTEVLAIQPRLHMKKRPLNVKGRPKTIYS